MSVSALNNYIECPWKYFFNNLLRIPEKIEDSGLFGNAIHDSINQFIIALKKGKATKELLIDKFNKSKYLKSITPQELERFIKRGEEALNGFYDEKLSNLSKDVESEIEIRGIRINDDVFLNGKIDMIEPIDKNYRVNVYDFKTGGIKTRNEIEGKTQSSDGNYKRQLVFYKILLDSFRNGFYRMQNGIIEFVEPNDNGIYKREVFDMKQEEQDELLVEIKKVAKEIVDLSFWNSTCGKKDCEYCKLRSYMLSSKSN